MDVMAITFSASLFIYTVCMHLIPFEPWNDLERMQKSLRNAEILWSIPFILYPCVYYFEIMELLGIYILYTAMYLAVQVRVWWIPYVRGSMDPRLKIRAYIFERTHRFLESRGERPVPDTQHIIQQVIGTIVLISITSVFFQMDHL